MVKWWASRRAVKDQPRKTHVVLTAVVLVISFLAPSSAQNVNERQKIGPGGPQKPRIFSSHLVQPQRVMRLLPNRPAIIAGGFIPYPGKKPEAAVVSSLRELDHEKHSPNIQSRDSSSLLKIHEVEHGLRTKKNVAVEHPPERFQGLKLEELQPSSTKQVPGPSHYAVPVATEGGGRGQGARAAVGPPHQILPPYQGKHGPGVKIVQGKRFHAGSGGRKVQPHGPRKVIRKPESTQGGGNINSLEGFEYEESQEEEPDRLSLLLPNSKFHCGGKNDGYYADDSLGCEVFHYCQAGGKHSWICPEGFRFHQVHLICMPPSSDNSCKESPKFHFVNDYLYQPINEKEASATNSTLIYADRYYPDGYSVGTDILPSYDSQEVPVRQEVRAPPSFKFYSNRREDGPYIRAPSSHHHRPSHNIPKIDPRNPVFFSAEGVNIPLNQRRPIPSQVHASSRQGYDKYRSTGDYDDDY